MTTVRLGVLLDAVESARVFVLAEHVREKEGSDESRNVER